MSLQPEPTLRELNGKEPTEAIKHAISAISLLSNTSEQDFIDAVLIMVLNGRTATEETLQAAVEEFSHIHTAAGVLYLCMTERERVQVSLLNGEFALAYQPDSDEGKPGQHTGVWFVVDEDPEDPDADGPFIVEGLANVPEVDRIISGHRELKDAEFQLQREIELRGE